MKKMLFGLCFLTMSVAAAAQATFGVKLGPDFSSLRAKSEGNKITSKGLIGAEGGVYVNLPVAPELVFQPALMYVMKGGKYDLGQGYTQTQRLHYISLPLDLLYRPPMPYQSGSWYVGGGPYLAYGVSGKISQDVSNNYSVDPFKNYGDGAALKRFDAGAHVQVGYEMSSGFNVGLNAAIGLLNIATEGNSQHSFHNTALGLTLGYAWHTH